jgi:hypothetical protein
MSPQLPESLARLARSNPAPLEPGRVSQPAAQALLEQILATPRSTARRARIRRSPRLIAIVATAGLVAAGGAVAATDPFGFWRSTTPGSAMYGIDSTKHVRTLTLQAVECLPAGGGLRCGVHVGGQRYELEDTATAPPELSREMMRSAIERSTQLSSTQKRQFKADLAAVSDDFLARFNRALHFASYSTSEIPPPGVPVLIACQPAGRGIVCEDMNGDEAVPAGSAIYGAIPGPGWRPQSQSGPEPSMSVNARMMKAIFGGPLTPAEYRFLRDFFTPVATASGGVSHAQARPAG